MNENEVEIKNGTHSKSGVRAIFISISYGKCIIHLSGQELGNI